MYKRWINILQGALAQSVARWCKPPLIKFWPNHWGEYEILYRTQGHRLMERGAVRMAALMLWSTAAPSLLLSLLSHSCPWTLSKPWAKAPQHTFSHPFITFAFITQAAEECSLKVGFIQNLRGSEATSELMFFTQMIYIAKQRGRGYTVKLDD